MSRRKTPANKRTPADKRGLPAVVGAELARPCLRLLLVAICTARPLLPSEGVSWIGDGGPFNLMLLLLAIGYLLLALVQGGLSRRLDLIDGAVATFVGLCVISAIIVGGAGSPRFAMNMLWEWVGFGLLFFLVRQLIRTSREARALVAVMIALAFVLSADGFYQVFVGLPANRAAYAESPDELLRSVGQWYPEGSSERLAFENRLQSTEPLATFALTNSLAGFLTPWLLALLGIIWSIVASLRGQEATANEASTRREGRLGLLRVLALGLCALAISACLMLTKSRSAYVAVLIGMLLLPFCSATLMRRFPWKVALSGAVAVALLVGGALLVKGLDAEVLTEASKSLGYRLEYWEATLGMIADYPWLGVGPGNFQDYYTQYKLPQASEEIRDPHNFLLEVWATAGTFAFVVFLEILGLFIWRTLRAVTPAATLVETSDSASPVETTRSVAFMFAGGATGMFAAFLLGPLVGWIFSEERMGCGLILGAIVIALLWPWVIRGNLPSRLPAVAAMALAIHWLAAGGIAFPGVAYSFWILLALGLNQIEPESKMNRPGHQVTFARVAIFIAIVALCASATACYLFAFVPVFRLRVAMAEVEEARQKSPNSPAIGVMLLDAAKADPFSVEPWTVLAELEFERLMRDPARIQSHHQLQNATVRMLELRPHSSSIYRQIGYWLMQIFERDHTADVDKAAVASLKSAVGLYPNSANLRAEYALALRTAGELSQAHKQAEAALRLDGQTPHADKKLPPSLKQQLHDFQAEN